MKYKVQIEYNITGRTSFEVEAEDADEAAEWANKNGGDYAVEHSADGNFDVEVECIDSRPA